MLPAADWTSEELLLLNEELILALRSGVGLELGLRNAGPGLSGRLRTFASDLSRSIDGGASLPDALAALNPPAPALYRVLVATGLKGNALEVVLIRMGEFARLMAELRQTLFRAMIYPWGVALVAFVLAVLMTHFTAPPLLEFVADFRSAPTVPIRMVQWLHANLLYWSVGVPAAVGLWWAFVWVMQRVSRGDAALGAMRYVPGFGPLSRWADLARLSHLLAIQTEFGIPLPESLRSCGDVVQDGRLRTFCQRAAIEVEQGRPPSEKLLDTPGVPTFLKWTLSGASGQADLTANLHQAAEVYRERTLLRAEWIGRILPGLLAVTFGAAIVSLYAWVVFGTLISVWRMLL